MASINSIHGSLNENIGYVKIQDYNKLKVKYDNKIRENKALKEFIENLNNSYESIKDNKKNVEEMFIIMNEFN